MISMFSAYWARLLSAVAVASRPYRFSAIGKAKVYVLVCGALFGASQPASAQFIQQGAKLVGNNAVGTTLIEQGASVALSADGNTALVGAPYDNWDGSGNLSGGVGAAWVYTRSGGVWTQQAKLIGTGYSGGTPGQGWSVALSSDGNTALVGGSGDNGGKRSRMGLHPQRHCLEPASRPADRQRGGQW
jgi:hypothetical protein